MGKLLQELLKQLLKNAPKKVPKPKYKPKTNPAKKAEDEFPKEKNCATKSCVKNVKASVDSRKFSEYIFKEGADHGKDKVFKSLGYGKQHSDDLAKLYQKQALEKYKKGAFSHGKKDQYGQRIDIEIELPGIGNAKGKTSYLKSGWMIMKDGNIKLNTPFTGFTR